MSRTNDEPLDVFESIRANVLLSEASEEFKTTEIKYPDSLIELWKVFANAEPTKEEEDHAILVFRKLTTILHKKVRSFLYTGSSQMTVIRKIDDVLDFLIYDVFINEEHHVLRPCPVSILSEQAFVHRMRKFLAKRNNPVSYELDTILREAILALAKEGKVKLYAAVGGTAINHFTLFYLSGGSPDIPGSFENYQQKEKTIPMYRAEMRGSDWTKTRMITPIDAKKLVLQLLDAFGGAVGIATIQKAARRHIPDQMWVIENESDKKFAGVNENDESILENTHCKSQENFYATQDFFYATPENFDALKENSYYIEKFYWNKIGVENVKKTTENIWNRITELEGNQLFCLYYIPEQFGESQDKKRNLSDFGASQTVSDKNRKINQIWVEEHKLIEGVQGCSRLTGLQRKAVRDLFLKIFNKLYGRCTENGYNPGLSSSSGLGNLADLFKQQSWRNNA